MFFFRKKQVNEEAIKGFNDAIEAIKTFIFVWEWEKAHEAITEIREKELEGFNELIAKVPDENMVARLKKEHDANDAAITALEQKLRVNEQADKDKIAKITFKLKFKKIKEEIYTLSKTSKHHEALTLLGSFLQDNKENPLVINFYNTEKKSIIKALEQQRRVEEDKIKKSARQEAMKLIGETLTIGTDDPEKNKKDTATVQEQPRFSFFDKVKEKFSFYQNIIDRIKKKQLIDEVTLLIESENQINLDIARNKLEKIHQWLIKELFISNIAGYEFFWKILWADKISWDTFGFFDDKDKYDFFLWDATGHGVRAGLIVSLLTRLFNKHTVGNFISKIVFEVNNGLKQDLQSRNFITWIFFEIDKVNISRIKYVWVGHEPMIVFRRKTQTIEKLIPGWLAAWIRIIKEESMVKVKDFTLEDGDILMVFSDGVVESKDMEGNFYGFERLFSTFDFICKKEKVVWKIYDYLMQDIKLFRGGAKFDDDSTIVLLQRNISKDIIRQEDSFLKDIASKEGLGRLALKKLAGKSREEVEKELEKIRKEKEVTNIVKTLETLYYTW
jgi:serine phosphatase RsbU (regulator of sigma subunit)